jgi:hypothetical protein
MLTSVEIVDGGTHEQISLPRGLMWQYLAAEIGDWMDQEPFSKPGTSTLHHKCRYCGQMAVGALRAPAVAGIG